MTDLPAIRSRIEALADWLTEHVKTLPTETRVWPNKLAGYIDTLRTVLALLAGPGEGEVGELVASLRDRHETLTGDVYWKRIYADRREAADLIERLAVRLEAEKRAREDAQVRAGGWIERAAQLEQQITKLTNPGVPDDRE